MHAAPSSRPRIAPARWGLPPLRGRGWLLAAALIDSTGSGLLYAFAAIFFLYRTSLALTSIGLALTVGQLCALGVPAACGTLVDRFGARRLTITGNLVSAAGYLGFVWAHQLWQVTAVCITVQAGVAMYWTAYSPMVGECVPTTDRVRWFGLIHAARNAGVGLGGALAGILLATAGSRALAWFVMANVASYLLAAGLVGFGGARSAGLAPAVGQTGSPPGSGPTVRRGGYREVLADRRFLLLIGINIAFVLSTVVLNVLLAIYLVETLHRPAWIAGALLTLNTALVAGLQTAVAGWSESHRTGRIIALAAVVNTAAFGCFWLVAGVPHWLLLPGLVTAVIAYTMAEVLSSPALSSLSVSLPRPELRGRYQAIYQTSWTVGGAIGPALFIWLLSRGAGWPWLVLIVTSLSAGAAAVRLERRAARHAHARSRVRSQRVARHRHPASRAGTGVRRGHPRHRLNPRHPSLSSPQHLQPQQPESATT
jgi:MFS family permease